MVVCKNCGQSARIKEVNLKYILQEIPNSVFQVDRGLLYTIKELFTRPGHTIREYLGGKRIAHFKPIAFVLLLATLYVLLSLIIDQNTLLGDIVNGFSQASKDRIERGDGIFSKAMPRINSFLTWMSDNYAYTTLILLPFGALTTFIAFLGEGYNYFEHLIINLYIEGQKLVIYLLFVLVLYIISNETLEDYLEAALFFIPILFAAWTFVQLSTRGKKVITILRLLLSYVLYFILFNVVITLGILIIAGIYYIK